MTGEPILIVDDTPVNLKLTRMLLEHEGYQVRTAATAEEALVLLEDFHPRLVLADIQLPGMDGLEMTRRIKADPRNRGVLVVALTAYAMKGDEEKALAAGCDGYITKPIDTRDLGIRLREYMGRGPSWPPPAAGLATLVPDMQELRRQFLDDGLCQIHRWREDPPHRLDTRASSSAAHQWVGSGGLLGFPGISLRARELEQSLRETPIDLGRLAQALDLLEDEFSNPTPAGATPPPAPVYALPPARVLLAGADAGTLAMVKAILESQAVDCLAADDGLAALQAALDYKPDVAVLDADLPRLNGCQVLEAIRERGLPVKVMLLGADARPGPAGADDCLAKPFQPFDLVIRLKRLL